jgi:hypothetical protein
MIFILVVAGDSSPRGVVRRPTPSRGPVRFKQDGPNHLTRYIRSVYSTCGLSRVWHRTARGACLEARRRAVNGTPFQRAVRVVPRAAAVFFWRLSQSRPQFSARSIESHLTAKVKLVRIPVTTSHLIFFFISWSDYRVWIPTPRRRRHSKKLRSHLLSRIEKDRIARHATKL